jgi:dienelactone hydrolase
MKVLSFVLLGGLVLFSTLQAQTPQKTQDEWAVPVKRAQACIQLLQQGKYDSVQTYFDANMKRALPADKLQSMWKTLQEQTGAFQETAGIRTEMLRTYHVVCVTCVFKEGKLDAKVVFNDKNKIAGLFFVPHRESGSYKAPAYVNPKAFTEIDTLKLPNRWHLPASLSLPDGGGPFPAVVLLHGSGPNDRDETIGPNKPFRDLAWGLASRGIAVLRYEKRTRVYPNIISLTHGKFTVVDETIDDALSAVTLLRRNPKIDGQKVIILGHSLGGMLVPRIAATDKRVAGFIIMAGAARPITELMKEQYRYIFLLDGTLTEAESQKLHALDSLVALTQSLPYLNKANPTSLVLGAPPAYWKDLLHYHPLQYAERMHRPVLVLQGGKDYQVTLTDFNLWKTHLQSDSQASFKFYPRLNHLFMVCSGKPSPSDYEKPGHVAKQVIEDIARWIKDF